MHSLGVVGHLRRIYDPSQYEFLQSIVGMNIVISMAAFVLGAAQLVFLFNFFSSIFWGKKASVNPWNATTLEWELPSPPGHGNFGPELPTVKRWPFDFSVPGAEKDYIMQTESPKETTSG